MKPIRRKRIALNMDRVHGINTPDRVPSVFLLSVLAPGPGGDALLAGCIRNSLLA